MWDHHITTSERLLFSHNFPAYQNHSSCLIFCRPIKTRHLTFRMSALWNIVTISSQIQYKPAPSCALFSIHNHDVNEQPSWGKEVSIHGEQWHMMVSCGITWTEIHPLYDNDINNTIDLFKWLSYLACIFISLFGPFLIKNLKSSIANHFLDCRCSRTGPEAH